MPTPLVFTICASNGAKEQTIAGTGSTRDEALNNAITILTGWTILWGRAQGNADIPSTAAPHSVGDVHARTFEDMADEAGQGGECIEGYNRLPSRFQLGDRVKATHEGQDSIEGEVREITFSKGRVSYFVFDEGADDVESFESFEVEPAAPREPSSDEATGLGAPGGESTASASASLARNIGTADTVVVIKQDGTSGLAVTAVELLELLKDGGEVEGFELVKFGEGSEEATGILQNRTSGSIAGVIPAADASDPALAASRQHSLGMKDPVGPVAGTVPTSTDRGFTGTHDHDGPAVSGLTGERAPVLANDFTVGAAKAGTIQPLPGTEADQNLQKEEDQNAAAADTREDEAATTSAIAGTANIPASEQESDTQGQAAGETVPLATELPESHVPPFAAPTANAGATAPVEANTSAPVAPGQTAAGSESKPLTPAEE